MSKPTPRKSEPLVSVVTPVFNRAREVMECSYSIITQTYQNWEHIIVDDASTDQTQEVLRSATDFRIKPFFQEKNQGPQFAYKRGFEEAKGKYVILQDSDDVATPDRIQKCVEYLESHPEVDVLYHGLYQMGQHSVFPVKIMIYVPALPWDPERLKKEQYVPMCCAIRREVLEKYTPDIRARGSWDWYFLLQLMKSGARFAPLDVGLYIYNRHEQGLAVQNENSGKREQSFRFIQNYVRQRKG